MARSSRSFKAFNVRMPESLRVLLDKSAQKNNRSTTAELLTILEKALIETESHA